MWQVVLPGGAALGVIGGPIGIGIGALLGAGVAVAKKGIFGDRGVGKAKSAAKDEFNVCRAECHESMRQYFGNIEHELTRFQNHVINLISRELSNLSEMQKQTQNIYQFL